MTIAETETVLQGNIVAVEEYTGTSFAEDVAQGSMTFVVADSAYFDPNGGKVFFGDNPTNEYAYSSMDGETNTVTLVNPMPYAREAGMVAAPRPLEYRKIAFVDFVGDFDEAQMCTIPAELEPYISLGIRDPEYREYVEVGVIANDYVLLRMPNEKLYISGSSIDPDGMPYPGPDGQAPPQVTGLVAESNVQTVFLKWDPVVNTDPVRYRVYGGTNNTVPVDTNHFICEVAGPRAVVDVAWDDANAVQVKTLSPEVNYYFRVVAVDEDVDNGTAPALPSAVVTSKPAKINHEDINVNAVRAINILANEIGADKLEALIAIATRFEVGDYMSLEAGQGLKTEPPNGMGVHITDDGTPNIFNGETTLDRATVRDYLDVQGNVNKISGRLNLSTGIVAPTVAPVVSASGWSAPLMFQQTGAGEGFNVFGLTKWPGENRFAYMESLYGGQLWYLNAATGAREVGFFNMPSNFCPEGGIAATNDFFYILGFDIDRNSDWYIYRYNRSDLQKNGELRVGLASAILGKMSICKVDDATQDIAICYIQNTNRLVVRRYNISLSLQANMVEGVDWNFPQKDLIGLYYGQADYGAERIIIAHPDEVRAFTFTSSTLTFNHAWAKPNNEQMRGLCWDGGRFHTFGSSTWRLYHFSKQIDISPALWAYSLYDSDSVGGTHETQPGKTVSFTPIRRAWTTVRTPQPVVTGAGVDDPDAARFYRAGKLQATVAGSESQNSITAIDIINMGSADAPVSNGFASLPGQNGDIVSGKTDSNGALIRLEGGGAMRLGDYGMTADGSWTGLFSDAPNNFARLGTAGAPGSLKVAARADHVHPPALLPNLNATIGPNLTGSVNGYRMIHGAAFFVVNLTTTANLAANAVLFTVPAVSTGSRPPVNWLTDVVTLPGVVHRVHIGTDGVALLQSAVASGQTLRATIIYPFFPTS